MKRGLFAALLVSILSWGGVAHADHASAVGVWFTEDGKSKVEIYDCSSKLCGKITWLKEPLTEAGKEKVDANNPDEGLKTRKILGLNLLSAFIPDEYEKHGWTNGKIYNPEDGETYSCNMELLDDGTLKVRGYVGLPMFGKTQIWKPAG